MVIDYSKRRWMTTKLERLVDARLVKLRILEAQPDLLEEKSMLETVINAAGHEV